MNQFTTLQASMALFLSLCLSHTAASQSPFWQQTNGPDCGGDFYSLEATGTGAVVIGTYGKILRSTNAGQSWAATSFTGGFVNDIKLRPNGELFAATNAGIYRSANDGVTWGIFALPSAILYCIAFKGTDTVLAEDTTRCIVRQTGR